MKGRPQDENTVTVTGSRSVCRADGRASIVLETKELGAIAFEVDQRALAALRREIAAVEEFLQSSGSA